MSDAEMMHAGKTSARAASDPSTDRPVAMKRARVLPDLVRVIATDVVSGRIAPGETLAPETELGARYGVSRTVVREALKVLAAKGLVQSRSRIGTVVCARETWNLLDPQVMDWHGKEFFDRGVLDAMLETRLAFEPFVARLAAERATLNELARMDDALDGMTQADGDTAAFSQADIAFHRCLYQAAHNPFLERIGALVDTALKHSIETTAENTREQRSVAIGRHRAVVEALRMRDGKAAEAAILSIINQAATDIELAAEKRSKAHDPGGQTT